MTSKNSFGQNKLQEAVGRRDFVLAERLISSKESCVEYFENGTLTPLHLAIIDLAHAPQGTQREGLVSMIGLFAVISNEVATMKDGQGRTPSDLLDTLLKQNLELQKGQVNRLQSAYQANDKLKSAIAGFNR